MAPPSKRAGFSLGSDEEREETRNATNRSDPGLKLSGFTAMSQDADDDGGWPLSSDPQTPNLAESAQQLRRSLSVHGLHELANMPPGELRKSVGSKIWRPQDEQAKIPSDWERLAVHVLRGGLRSFNLAFMLRGSIMALFVLIRTLRSKKAQGKAFLLAIFGADNIRFGLMFAAWSMLYKATSNSLRLITPLPPTYANRSRSKRAKSAPPSADDKEVELKHTSRSGSGEESGIPSGTATPRSGFDQLEGKEGKERMLEKAKQKRRAFMLDPRSRVWHAYLAGAVSGLAILVERKDSRISLAQQLLVRGLEGTYNTAHSRGLVSIPHGAVLTFGLACGQIMYAWLNQPHTLPRGYISWITSASKVAPPVLPLHRQLMANGKGDPEQILKLFPDGKLPTPRSYNSAGKPLYAPVIPTSNNRRGITGKNVGELINIFHHLKAGQTMYHVPCPSIHPWENSHIWSPIDRFIEVTRWILPVYMTLHFVPAIFLRMGAFRKDPIRVFLRSLFGSVRSSSFLGVFVIIFQTIFCKCHELHDRVMSNESIRSVLPTWLVNFLVSQHMHWIAGFLTCLSLFVEHSRRRTELAMYVLPKGMESAWSVARQRSWLPFVPGGDLLLTSAGMSLVMGTYAQSPEHLSGIVRRIVYQFVGRN